MSLLGVLDHNWYLFRQQDGLGGNHRDPLLLFSAEIMHTSYLDPEYTAETNAWS